VFVTRRKGEVAKHDDASLPSKRHELAKKGQCVLHCRSLQRLGYDEVCMRKSPAEQKKRIPVFGLGVVRAEGASAGV
jgi:hypothetical protein